VLLIISMNLYEHTSLKGESIVPLILHLTFIIFYIQIVFHFQKSINCQNLVKNIISVKYEQHQVTLNICLPYFEIIFTKHVIGQSFLFNLCIITISIYETVILFFNNIFELISILALIC
jgi:hypothetical protein